jgi:hypothetical protein
LARWATTEPASTATTPTITGTVTRLRAPYFFVQGHFCNKQATVSVLLLFLEPEVPLPRQEQPDTSLFRAAAAAEHLFLPAQWH